MTDVLNEREVTDDRIDTKPKPDTVTKDKEEIDETKRGNENEAETETNASSVTSNESKQALLETKFAQAELALKKIKADSKKLESDVDNNIEKVVDKLELANGTEKVISSNLLNESKADNAANNGAKVETVMSENASIRKHSGEGVPGLNVDNIDKTKTNSDTETPVAADNAGCDSTTSKVEWSLNGTELDLKEEVKDKLVLPTCEPQRRVSFGDENISIKEYELLADRRRSEGMSVDMKNRHNSYRKHSSGDLHSRLKTRKLLGVGETDDGDVHRSKLSQILGHSDQLYIRLPSGLRLWQILLSILFSVMSLWALIFPSHYFMSMYETDGQSYTFPIRLYATALVCIAVMYWSTIQASDRDVIRLVLLSSIVFFALQTLVLMTSWLPWHPVTSVTHLSPILTLSTWLLVISVSSYFYWITYREGKSKDIRYYR